jgi:hypothetical protein
MGMDGYQEETYFGVVAAGLERGYNCLTYDGSSQGGVLTAVFVKVDPTD